MAKKLPPVHPGEILREEFLVPLKLTPYAVAAALNVPRTRIERIARRKARYSRHRATAWKIFQDRRCILDEHAGALRPRNRRRRARAADQEDRLLQGCVKWMQKPALDSRFSRFANSKQKLSVIKSIFELWRSQGESNPCFSLERAAS